MARVLLLSGCHLIWGKGKSEPGELKIWLAGETVNKARPFRPPALLFVYPAFSEGKAGFFFSREKRSNLVVLFSNLEGGAGRGSVSIDGHAGLPC